MCVGSSDRWFMKSPLSQNILSSMTKCLSEVAGLSQCYTNHCLRVKSIVLMKGAGLEDRKIMAVSGHKCVTSLQACDRPTSSDSKVAAAAIDRKPLSSSSVSNVAPAAASGTTVAVPSATFVTDSPTLMPVASAASPSLIPHPTTTSFVGSTVSNLTINNIFHPPAPKKKKLSLKLKKKGTASYTSEVRKFKHSES